LLIATEKKGIFKANIIPLKGLPEESPGAKHLNIVDVIAVQCFIGGVECFVSPQGVATVFF